MEYGLGRCCRKSRYSDPTEVLILVLMEYGLGWATMLPSMSSRAWVLILVLMEYGLGRMAKSHL